MLRREHSLPEIEKPGIEAGDGEFCGIFGLKMCYLGGEVVALLGGQQDASAGSAMKGGLVTWGEEPTGERVAKGQRNGTASGGHT